MTLQIAAIKYGMEVLLGPGADHVFTWQLPDHSDQPIAEMRVEATSEKRASGTLYLDSIIWGEVLHVWLGRPAEGGNIWRRAWVNGTGFWRERISRGNSVSAISEVLQVVGTRRQACNDDELIFDSPWRGVAKKAGQWPTLSLSNQHDR